MKNLYLAPILSALLLSACTSASGPTFSAYELQPRDGIRTYQVDCHGIFSSQATCMKVATRMCADQPVRAVDSTRPLRDGADPGTLVFQCGAAAGAAASAPAPVAAAPAPVQNVSLSSDALFAFGSATLTPAARATLDKLTSQQGDPHFTRVAVTGHTDAIGSDTSNLQLSQQRADAVAGYLRERGLRADTFVVTGRGKADPVASNATAEGRAGNRRVEIVLQR
ncbi:ompA family protein [Burkholderia sp. MSHR3999]|uniref:OmpA family protein n=1 Tax=Burkholderia sp. MSHR3999 TaxID=1542965 RepID=UPI0005ACACC0|nr:OmpA family protein [Burkholderia sp. MSHR3999]KIP16991.1 ompA family protein [Burkholderia sp. MSHR3999]